MSGAILVSYSRLDVGLMKPVVGLLRATKDIVFQDLDGIRPGGKWRRQIEDAILAAHLVVLFWCYHSSRSAEVRAEYKLALATGKDVLPVLLDTTPLPEELNEFQWVDFQQLVGSVHRSYRRWIALGVVSLLIVLIMGFGLLFMTLFKSIPVPTPETSPPPSIYPTPEPKPDTYPMPEPMPEAMPEPSSRLPKWLWLAIFGVTILAIVVWRGQRARRRRTAEPPTNYQQLMAEKLQREIVRRGIGLE